MLLMDNEIIKFRGNYTILIFMSCINKKKLESLGRRITCLRKPAPKALVTFKEPFTRWFTTAQASSRCSDFIL